MTKDEVLKMAIEHGFKRVIEPPCEYYKATEEQIEAFAKALAEQPTQEPVGFYHKDTGQLKVVLSSPPDLKSEWLDVYTHPPKEWQGLSDDEIGSVVDDALRDWEGSEAKYYGNVYSYLARAIEAKLREKNT